MGAEWGGCEGFQVGCGLLGTGSSTMVRPGKRSLLGGIGRILVGLGGEVRAGFVPVGCSKSSSVTSFEGDLLRVVPMTGSAPSRMSRRSACSGNGAREAPAR